MRINITTILLLIGCMQISATSRSQTISLKANAQSLTSIFSAIEKQTGYYVIYNSQAVRSTKPVTITATNMPLQKFLDEVLAARSLNYTIDEKTIMVTRSAGRTGHVGPSIVEVPQDREINGCVISQNGEPVAGVTVAVKGSSIVTATDGEGQYRITVPSTDAVLVFTSMGFAPQERAVGTSNELHVTLQESLSGLDEVVVVGYGTQKRSEVVGSVVQMQGEELQKAPPMNITNVLAGRLPGLTTVQTSGRPGQDDATLRIRGTGTYGENQAPLVIIDGVQRPSFAHLDASEIESVTLLKDAVSTAVYGLQAANGIILVTTKKGTKQKPSISYDGSYVVGQNTRFPKFLDAVDYMLWYNAATDMDNDYRMHTGQDPVPYVYGPTLISNIRNGTNENPLFGSTDWIGELVGRNSHSQHHAVTVSGGGESVRYFTSVAHLDQDGVVENTNFKRYNIRSNVSADISNSLTVDLNLSGRHENRKTPGIPPDDGSYLNPFYQAAMMLPNLPMYAPNGLYTAHRANPGWVNPLASVENSGFHDRQSNVFQGDLTFRWDVPWIEGFSAQLMTAYDKTGNENKGWLEPYELMGRNHEQVTGGYTELSEVPGIPRTALTQSYTQNNRRTFQPSLRYVKEFGDHNINVLALYEWSKYQTSSLSAGARNFPILGLYDLDFGSVAPEDVVRPGGVTTLDLRAGYVGRINYTYKNRYLLEMAMRFDASINFAPEHRWHMFPGVGAGWIASEESFFNVPSLSYLKFKASYGKAGNDRVGRDFPFPYLQTYALTEDPTHVIGNSTVSGIVAGNRPNPALIWETSQTFNGGFESEWLNGKFGLDVEYFYRLTDDILNTVAGLYPPSMGGYYVSRANVGMMENRGIDLQIRHKNVLGDFRYGITGNFNWARNKILRMDEDPNLPAWQRRVGRSYGEKLGFVVDGIYQNWEETKDAVSPSGGIVAPGFFKYRDLNNDGRITRTEDMTFIGRSNIPEMMFGLNLDMQYKGFDFSALLQGAALSDVLLSGAYQGSSGTEGIESFTVMSRPFYQNGNAPYFLVENSWTPENPDAEFPRLTAGRAALGAHNAHNSSGFLRNGAYLRLRSIQVGYTLPKDVLQSMKIDRIRVYATGSNLFTWDHLKYFDPEMPNVNNGFYPQQRLFSFGVNVTFN